MRDKNSLALWFRLLCNLLMKKKKWTRITPINKVYSIRSVKLLEVSELGVCIGISLKWVVCYLSGTWHYGWWAKEGFLEPIDNQLRNNQRIRELHMKPYILNFSIFNQSQSNNSRLSFSPYTDILILRRNLDKMVRHGNWFAWEKK